MAQPGVRVDEDPLEHRESGRPVWALLGLLAAVSVAVFIMALGFSAA